MIHENSQNESELRRFLFGEMSEDERTAFEEKFITDEALFEQTRVVEDELIESYVRGAFSFEEKGKFERVFLSTEARRRRVAFARTMLDQFAGQNEILTVEKVGERQEKSSVWISITDLFKTRKLVFGAAFALLILIFGGWLSLRDSNQTEIARQITPPPPLENLQANQNLISTANQNVSINSNANFAVKDAANKNAPLNANREIPNKNQSQNVQKPNSTVAAPVLALFAGTVRGDGRTSEVSLPENADRIYLHLNLESEDYKIYRVEIVDADGNLILRNNNLKAKNSKINLAVPTEKLRRGDYMVKLSALNQQNEDESVADYTFRVNRK